MRRFIATSLIQLYPRAWRGRYAAEVSDLVSQSPPRWRDLLDLMRGALNEWEHQIACGRWRILKTVVAAYSALVVTFGLTITLSAWLQGPGRFSSRTVLILTSLAFWNVFFYTPLFIAGLVMHAPVIVGLRLIRRSIPLGAARLALATGFTVWFEWAWYQMEWFDVWRHGFPGIEYLMLFMVPQGLAFAAAGAIVGGALVRDRDGHPARWKAAR